MIDRKKVKAILFDSGHTLNYPRSGNWFIPPRAFNIVDVSKFIFLDRKLIEKAFNKGNEFLNEKRFVLSEAEEFEVFKEFYSIVFNEAKDIKVSDSQIYELAKDIVYNDSKFVFYDDVFEVIPKLAKVYKLGIVSDTWPSLERVFRNAGIRKYFSSFVTSCALGVCKPDRLMYEKALSELKIAPNEALFIDDSVANVEGAIKLGLQGALVLRKGNNSTNYSHLNTINNLWKLQELLKV